MPMMDMFAPLHKMKSQAGLSRRQTLPKDMIVKPPEHFSRHNKERCAAFAGACGMPKLTAKQNVQSRESKNVASSENSRKFNW
jgi:hypothetical protein